MKNLKQKIKNIPILGEISVKIYRTISPPNTPTYWIKRYLPVDDAIIVQIGSNDGKTGDPIYHLFNQREKWKAIFVEPVPYLFKRLKHNFKSDTRFTFENFAINDGKEQIFYSVKQEAKEKFPDLPAWFDQLGSFNKNNILKHLNGKLEPFIEETRLQGITLTNLLSRNSVDFIDLLHIDTEGYDWKILCQLPLDRYKPTLILFEHKHLEKVEKKESIEFLSNHYYIFDFISDFLAVKKDVIKKGDLYKIGNKMITQSNIV